MTFLEGKALGQGTIEYILGLIWILHSESFFRFFHNCEIWHFLYFKPVWIVDLASFFNFKASLEVCAPVVTEMLQYGLGL